MKFLVFMLVMCIVILGNNTTITDECIEADMPQSSTVIDYYIGGKGNGFIHLRDCNDCGWNHYDDPDEEEYKDV